MTFVKLAGPAKIGGKRYQAGEIVEVDQDTADGLAVMGLSAEYPTELTAGPGVDLRHVDLAALPAGANLITVTKEQFDVAVAAKAEALAGAVTDGLMDGLENLNRRVEELQAELEAERTAHDETRAQMRATQGAAGQSDDEDTPPSDAASNAAPKKGGAGRTKG